MRRQCRRFEFQRILLPVRMRIHWGMGRFWAIFFASVRFVRKVLWDGCGGREGETTRSPRGVGFSWNCVCCVFVESVDRGPGRSQRASTGIGLSGVGRVRRSAAPLGPGARTSQELCDEAAVRVSVRPVALACARRAGGRAAAAAKARS